MLLAVRDKTCTEEDLLTAFDDITELFETSAPSLMNFCRMNGTTTMLEFAVMHQSA